MLDLTQTQTRILKTILENTNITSENKIGGLTSYELRKIGIPGRTFDINRDMLLHYQLITIVKEVKTGKQIRKWYRVTPIGIFYVLKITEINDIEKKINSKKFSELIPQIAYHWNELKEIFGENLNLILKHSIAQIDIHPVIPKQNKQINLGMQLMERELEEKTEIPFENEQCIIVLVRKYHTYSKNIKESVKYEPKLWDYDNYDDFLINLIDRLSFIFYFNLLRLNFSVYYRNKIIREMTEHYKKKKNSFTVIELLDNKLDIFSKYKSRMTVFKKTIKVIKKDKKLSDIIKENMDELYSKFQQAEFLNIITKEL